MLVPDLKKKPKTKKHIHHFKNKTLQNRFAPSTATSNINLKKELFLNCSLCLYTLNLLFYHLLDLI